MSAPSTPRSNTPSLPQAGAWKHPRYEEIARRQNAHTFSDKNVKQIVYNLGGIAGLYILDRILMAYIPSVFLVTKPLRPYSAYIYNAFRVLLIYNVIVALLPIIRPKDDLTDIPLTPVQRKLLGLSQNETPPTPGSTYITPPRFSRSASPMGGSTSPASSAREGSGTPNRNSPFSPNASPLFHKAVGGASRKTSDRSLFDAGASPSPSSGRTSSVGLNSKWLYEKGRASPGSANMFSQSTM